MEQNFSVFTCFGITTCTKISDLATLPDARGGVGHATPHMPMRIQVNGTSKVTVLCVLVASLQSLDWNGGMCSTG